MIKQRSRYDLVFFSPHLDDAVLSCGRLLAHQAKHQKIMIISVFTQGVSEPLSADTQAFLARSVCHSATELFTLRKREDEHAARILNTDFLHWDFIDAGFRLHAVTSQPLYPQNQAIFGGVISSQDVTLSSELKQKIYDWLAKYTHAHTQLFAPLGIGNHVDHLLVRDTLLALKKRPLVLWEDIPYRHNQHSKYQTLSHLEKHLQSPLVSYSPPQFSAESTLTKTAAIQCYATQTPSLQTVGGLSAIDLYQENYYTLT